MIVYISIGNSDDKLTQVQWVAFVSRTQALLEGHDARFHGNWRSLPDHPWQNACWCVEIEPVLAEKLQGHLATIAADYQQDSIAWSEVAVAKFIGPTVDPTPQQQKAWAGQ